MLEILKTLDADGYPMARQVCPSPSAYLDTCALRAIADEPVRCDRFLRAINRHGGTVANCLLPVSVDNHFSTGQLFYRKTGRTVVSQKVSQLDNVGIFWRCARSEEMPIFIVVGTPRFELGTPCTPWGSGVRCRPLQEVKNAP
jgi:hypothetical protein